MSKTKEEEGDACEYCGGSGETGPTGWEFPEYETCRDCGGSGKASDHADPDARFERERGK